MDIKRTGLLIVISFFLLDSCNRADEISIEDVPERGFMSNRPASSWEEALVTGNGIMGAMVMGFPYSDTIIVNHAELYMPLHKPLKPVPQGKNLEKIRSMMLNGQYGEASRFVVGLSHEKGWKHKRWTDPYIPAFNITIDMVKDSLKDYARTVNFQTGEAEVKWTDSKGTFSRKTFVSREDNLIVTSISSNGAVIDCRIGIQDNHTMSWWGNIDRSLGAEMEESKIDVTDNLLTYSCKFSNQWEGLISGYEGFLNIYTDKGKLTHDGHSIHISGGKEILLISAVSPYFQDEGGRLDSLIGRWNDVSSDYHELLAKHSSIHGEIFNRSRLSIGGNAERKKEPVEKLLAKKAAKPDPFLIEMEYDAARYNIISSTGINPPNLQGIWSGTLTPPWSADFTMNGNVPVAVSSMLPANMPELLLPLFNLLERNMEDFRMNARKLFNCEGIHVPSRMSSHGLNNHFDATWPMTFWTGGAGWYSMFYYDYYLFTGDLKFLKERALPFMEETMAFYDCFLKLGPNGKYIFNPSYSPENNPANSPFQATLNATMDVMIAKQFIRNIMATSKILGVNENKISYWEDMLQKMPEYELNAKGELREWIWPGIEENHEHRHVSQLYALYDLMDREFINNPELIGGARKVINKKMDFRRENEGGEMSFGMVQLAFAASMIGEAEISYDVLGWLTNNFWYNNMVTTHNPGNLFNLDLSGGYPAVIIKMLVYSEPGLLSLFPALPAEFSKGSIEGILARGNIEIKMLSWDNKQVQLQLVSKKNQNLLLQFPVEIESLKGNADKVGPGKDLRSRLLTLKEDNLTTISVVIKK